MPETVVFSDAYVWTFLGQLGILFIAILVGNVLRTRVPFLRKLYIPAAIIGGFLVLFLKQIPALTPLVDNATMEIITYHCLGLGFAAMALKTAKEEKKVSTVKVVESGAIMAGGYLIQAIIGLIISIVFFFINGSFYAAGLILPMGFGQSTGSALSWGSNFEANYGFVGGSNFGLAVAAIGFIVGSVFGVIYLNIATRKGLVKPRGARPRDCRGPGRDTQQREHRQAHRTALPGCIGLRRGLRHHAAPGRRAHQGRGRPRLGPQLPLGAGGRLPHQNSHALKKKNVIRRYYTNNHLMDRISGTMFDAMIAAGIMAIDIEDVIANIYLLIVTCAIGTLITFWYVRKATKYTYKGYEIESFLTNFGTLTGTLSTGMVLLREIDPDFVTPASSNIVLQNIPSIGFLAPLLLTLGFAASSLTNTFIMFAVYLILFTAYNVFLFRRRIFKKRYANKPEEVWTE